MIRSAKTILKKTQKNRNNMDRQNPRTNGKSKVTQIKSHKDAYTYTLRKREKGKNKKI